MESYQSSPKLAVDSYCIVLDWWKTHYGTYLFLSKLARKYFLYQKESLEQEYIVKTRVVLIVIGPNHACIKLFGLIIIIVTNNKYS